MSLSLIVLLLYIFATKVADVDLWGYLAFGRLFWQNMQFPYHDIFSYTPTLNLWVYHEWLTGVLFYPLYQSFGAKGLQILKYGLVLGTLGLIYLTARERGAKPFEGVFVLVLISLPLRIGYAPVRAQVFTYFFFALTLYILETSRLRGHWGRLWLIIPIMVFWCNLHGGFLSGLGIIGLYTLGEAISRKPFWPFLRILSLSCVATLINPYGFAYWRYLIRAVSMPRPEITEWGSIFQTHGTGTMSGTHLLYLFLLIVIAIFLALRAYWHEITAGLILICTAYLGLKNYRHEIFFLISLGVFIPLLITAYFDVIKNRPLFKLVSRLGSKFLTIIALIIFVAFTYKLLIQSPLNIEIPHQPNPDDKQISYYPTAAVDFIQNKHLSGTLLTFFNWGEYLIWKLFPDCKIALDGRYETVYPESVAKEYFNFIRARANWEQFLNNYPPDMILIPKKLDVYHLIKKDKKWREIYSDTSCILFLRDDYFLISNP